MSWAVANYLTWPCNLDFTWFALANNYWVICSYWPKSTPNCTINKIKKSIIQGISEQGMIQIGNDWNRDVKRRHRIFYGINWPRLSLFIIKRDKCCRVQIIQDILIGGSIPVGRWSCVHTVHTRSSYLHNTHSWQTLLSLFPLLIFIYPSTPAGHLEGIVQRKVKGVEIGLKW